MISRIIPFLLKRKLPQKKEGKESAKVAKGVAGGANEEYKKAQEEHDKEYKKGYDKAQEEYRKAQEEHDKEYKKGYDNAQASDRKAQEEGRPTETTKVEGTKKKEKQKKNGTLKSIIGLYSGRRANKISKQISSKSNNTQEKSFKVIDLGKSILSGILISALIFLAMAIVDIQNTMSFVFKDLTGWISDLFVYIISIFTDSGVIVSDTVELLIGWIILSWIFAMFLVLFISSDKKEGFLKVTRYMIIGILLVGVWVGFSNLYLDSSLSTGENAREIGEQGAENTLTFWDNLKCLLLDAGSSVCIERLTETEVKQSTRIDYYMRLDMPDSTYSRRDLNKSVRLQYTSVTGSSIELTKLECYYNSKKESNKFYNKTLEIEFDTENAITQDPRDLTCEHDLLKLKEHISSSKFQEIRIIPVVYFTVEKSIAQDILIYDYKEYARRNLPSGHSYSDYSLKSEIRKEESFNLEPTSNIPIPKVTFSSSFENSLPVIVQGDELDYIRFTMKIDFDEKDRDLGKVTNITITEINPPSSLELNPELELINEEFSANRDGVVEKTIELTEREGVTIGEDEVYAIQKLTINALINVENRQGFIYRLELSDGEIRELKNFGEPEQEYGTGGINVRWSGRLDDNQKRFTRENANSVVGNLKRIEFDGTNAYEFAKSQSSAKGIPFDMTLSIIAIESDGGSLNANSGKSAGLMQLSVPTGEIYGVSPSERKDPKKNIEAGTSYLRDLRGRIGNVNDVVAAYNGGEYGEDGALGESKDCPGLKRYECEWDDSEHTDPNDGYDETRDYVLKYRIASSIIKEKPRNEG